MQVYVLTSAYAREDCFSSGNSVIGVYEDIKEAQKKMKKEIKDAKADFTDYDTEDDNYVEGDMSWSIWEKGQYMSNHYDIQITECEVQK